MDICGFVFHLIADSNTFNIKKGTRNSASVITVEKMSDF